MLEADGQVMKKNVLPNSLTSHSTTDVGVSYRLSLITDLPKTFATKSPQATYILHVSVLNCKDGNTMSIMPINHFIHKEFNSKSTNNLSDSETNAAPRPSALTLAWGKNKKHHQIERLIKDNFIRYSHEN